MRIVDDETEIASPLLREVLTVWRSYGGVGPPPSTLAGPEFYEPASPWIAVVAVRGMDRFEIVFSSEGASCLLPALRDKGPVEPLLRRWWTRTVQARRPILERRIAPKASSAPGYEALALPFLGPSDKIDCLLCYVVSRDDANDDPPVWRPSTRSRRRIDD